MKRTIIGSVLAVFVFILGLGSCGSKEAVSSEHETSVVASTAISSSLQITGSQEAQTTEIVTSSAKPEIAEDGNFTGDDRNKSSAVPVQAYSEDRKQRDYVYVDKRSLIDYLDSGRKGEYFTLKEMEPMMKLPFHYGDASDFDENGLAMVSIVSDQTSVDFYMFLMNEDGENILKGDQKYFEIEKGGEYYFGYYYQKSEDVIPSCDVLNRKGEVLKTFPSSGRCVYSEDAFGGTLNFLHTDSAYDASAFEPRQSLSSEFAMFTKVWSLGEGYYAVSDLSDSEYADRLFVQNDMYPLAIPKAIYHEGVLLTDYKYYIVERLYGNVFYLFDGTDHYFENIRTGERLFSHTDGLLSGDYRFICYPDLIVARSDFDEVYITQNSVNHKYVVSPNGNYYIVPRRWFELEVHSPRVILNNKDAEKKINAELARLYGEKLTMLFTEDGIGTFGSHISSGVFSTDEVVGVTFFEYTDFLVDGKIRMNYTNYYFDGKTGEPMEFDEWFKDPEVAKAGLMAVVTNEYMDLRQMTEYPNNPDLLFDLENWGKYLTFNGDGAQLVFPDGVINDYGDGVSFVFISEDDLKLFLKEKYWKWYQEIMQNPDQFFIQ